MDKTWSKNETGASSSRQSILAWSFRAAFRPRIWMITVRRAVTEQIVTAESAWNAMKYLVTSYLMS